MELRETLIAIHEAGKAFHEGTQIVDSNRVTRVAETFAYLELIEQAKKLGATPYVISRAYLGEFITA